MKHVVVVSNCHTVGLVNSLRLINPELEVAGIEIGDFIREPEKFVPNFPLYAYVALIPGLEHYCDIDLTGHDNIHLIPSVAFTAYHPDLCIVSHDRAELMGPLSGCQSVLAVAGFKHGLSVADTMRLFNGKFYERIGYFERWENDRDMLMAAYEVCGMDLTAAFRRWSRDCFMHTFNHPKVNVVYDLAVALNRKWGGEERLSGAMPHDNLATSAVYPVYDEVAEALGVSGSYLFKKTGDYRQLTLEEFLIASFELYSACDPDKLTVNDAAVPQLELIRSLI